MAEKTPGMRPKETRVMGTQPEALAGIYDAADKAGHDFREKVNAEKAMAAIEAIRGKVPKLGLSPDRPQPVDGGELDRLGDTPEPSRYDRAAKRYEQAQGSEAYENAAGEYERAQAAVDPETTKAAIAALMADLPEAPEGFEPADSPHPLPPPKAPRMEYAPQPQDLPTDIKYDIAPSPHPLPAPPLTPDERMRLSELALKYKDDGSASVYQESNSRNIPRGRQRAGGGSGGRKRQ